MPYRRTSSRRITKRIVRRIRRKGRNYYPRYKSVFGRKRSGMEYGQFRLRYQTEVFNSANNTFAHYSNITDPHQAWDGAGTVQDLATLFGLYDFYRVRAYKIKFIPTYNTFEQATTTPTGTAPSCYFECLDFDNTTNGTTNSANTILEYDNCREHVPFRKWKRYTKIPTKVSPVGLPMGGWLDTGTPTYQSQGVISIFGTNGSANTTDVIGRVVIEYYLQFKSRR